jgi:hypothetical protein
MESLSWQRKRTTGAVLATHLLKRYLLALKLAIGRRSHNDVMLCMKRRKLRHILALNRKILPLNFEQHVRDWSFRRMAVGLFLQSCVYLHPMCTDYSHEYVGYTHHAEELARFTIDDTRVVFKGSTSSSSIIPKDLGSSQSKMVARQITSFFSTKKPSGAAPSTSGMVSEAVEEDDAGYDSQASDEDGHFDMPAASPLAASSNKRQQVSPNRAQSKKHKSKK